MRGEDPEAPYFPAMPDQATRVLALTPPRERVPLRRGALLALLVHAAFLGFLVRVAPLRSLDAESAQGPLDLMTGGGGGGGRQVAFVALPPAAPQPPPPRAPAVRPPPQPIPTPVIEPPPPPPIVPPVEAQPTSAVRPDSTATTTGSGSGPGSGSGSGGGSGSGKGPGTGAGSGPGGGESGRARPPEPRQLILPPPDVPKSLRGLTIAVSFLVAADGRVDRVTFSPDPPDRGFAKKLEEVMRSYRFRPARSAEGLPVPGTTTVSVTF